MDQPTERVSKLLAQRGLCSRREAAEFIRRGWVFLEGKPVRDTGARAGARMRITLAPQAQMYKASAVTILLNKPVGYVSGSPEPGKRPASSLINPRNCAGGPRVRERMLRGLAPAGRLDIDSRGLIVFTQDGRVARQLIGENSPVEKEYLVRVRGTLSSDGLELLRHGLSLDNRPLKPAKVEWLNRDQLRFVLKEGRKRQIRRMSAQVRLEVLGIKRVRIGRVRLGGLPEGRWRLLRAGECF